MYENREEDRQVITGEFQHAHDLEQPAVMYENLEQDLRLAAEFQRAVLPDQVPVPYLQSEVIYQPHSMVSGDVYNFIQNREQELGIFLGGATGHGIPAALLSMMIHLGLETIRRDLPTNESLRRLNQLLAARQTGLSVTGVYFRITPQGRLTVTHAAHPSLLILPADETREMIHFEKGGCALGIFEEEPVAYEEEEYQLMPGDKIIAYTDGITEWRQQGQVVLDHHGFMDLLLINRHNSLSDLAKNLRKQIDAHQLRGRCDDDLTLVMVEYRKA